MPSKLHLLSGYQAHFRYQTASTVWQQHGLIMSVLFSNEHLDTERKHIRDLARGDLTREVISNKVASMSICSRSSVQCRLRIDTVHRLTPSPPHCSMHVPTTARYRAALVIKHGSIPGSLDAAAYSPISNPGVLFPLA